jgi:hypothetical protein
MGFIAICKKCNYTITARTRPFLKGLMALHNAKSHQYGLNYANDFIVSVIQNDMVGIFELHTHSRHFWDAYNKAKKLP